MKVDVNFVGDGKFCVKSSKKLKLKLKICENLGTSNESRMTYQGYNNQRPEEVMRVHRTLDNLGGGYLLKRSNIDPLGGGYLLKRASNNLDSLGGGYLI